MCKTVFDVCQIVGWQLLLLCVAWAASAGVLALVFTHRSR